MMFYLKVPAVIYRAIHSVLSLYGEDDKIRWLQMDYEGNLTSIMEIDISDGKLKFVDSVEIDTKDKVSRDLLKYLVEGSYRGE